MFLQGGDTPLHNAASSGDHVMVKMLLDNECDIYAKNDVS